MYLIHPQHLLTSGAANPPWLASPPVTGVDHFQSGGWITFTAAGSARELWKAGAAAIFPAGTYWLRKFAGVNVESMDSPAALALAQP
jgi:hypothetical protein